MTFEAYETSAESGSPVELYEFRLGAVPYRYASSQEDVDVMAVTWEAVPIRRGNLGASSGDASSERLEVQLPSNVQPIDRFVRLVPGQRVNLTIRRYHTTDPDLEAVIIFKGAIQSVSFVDEGKTAVLQVAPSTIAKSRPVPRFTYQGLCNHMVYDARCKLDEHDTDFEFFFNCSAQTGSVVTLDGAGSEGPSDAFEMGFVEFDGEFRLVTAQSGDDLTLLLPFQTDPVGEEIRAVFGCKGRLIEDCQDKFDNVDNYGGFPFVPKQNPFETGLD